jgi:DNA-binding transcriptional MerR regulator
MAQRIKEYSVGDLARLAGVSVRTLHHYDEIGLLRPRHVGAKGYRSYGQDEAERLQEILFYREVGMALADIARLIEGGGGRLARLEAHRARLREEQDRLGQSLVTLEATIAALKENREMEAQDLYKPFSAEKQAAYEDWLIDRYGADMASAIRASKAHLKGAPEGMDARIAAKMAELKEIDDDLVAAFKDGRAEVAPLFERHRAWVASMWGKPCPPEAYAGLAELYESHPDFVARFEAMAPRFSGWLVAGMKAHAEGLEV